MAQTTTALPQGKCQVEVSVDAAAWTDISGQTTTVAISGGEQSIGEHNTFDGEYPVVIGSTKFSMTTATFSFIYTETAAQAFNVVYDRYKDGGTPTLAVRYSPAGGDSTEFRYFSSNNLGSAATLVPIVSCLPPDADASTGDAIMASFSVSAAQFKQETIS